MIIYRRLLLTALLLLPTFLFAQTADQYRGAWISDIDGTRHVLYIVLRDDKVSGIYCIECNNPDNLSFIDDGTLSNNALRFNLYHYPADQNNSIEEIQSTLEGENLVFTSASRTIVMHRAPAQVVPPPIADFRSNQPSAGRARTLPSNPMQLTVESVTGLWLWGVGPTKQYFIFKPHKDGIRGMVCGPCDSAKDFAPLENISIEGSNFHFEIVHEDNGGGFEEHGPFSNITDAQISMNEFHMTTYPSYAPDGAKIEMTLLGPSIFMPEAK